MAGLGNPYQFLMMKGLNSDSCINAKSGVNDRFFGILRTALNQKPDYIHFDWITSYYFRRNLWMTLLSVPLFILQIVMVKYIFNVKFVWTMHNVDPHDSNYPKIHNFCRRFFAKQTKWIRLFSEETKEKAEVKLNLKDKFVICPEGSYVDYYKNSVSKMAARKMLNISTDDFVYLYLGFIKPYKGIEELIYAFEHLDIPNKKLIIAGNVMNKNYFKSVFTKNPDVIFVNRFIENDELQNFFGASDVVVLPFKKVENSGSAILAMGFKKVIIAPKMGVLTKRLAKQKEFLYNEGELLEKLQFSIENRCKLYEIGGLNFNELRKYEWKNFTKYFKL